VAHRVKRRKHASEEMCPCGHPGSWHTKPPDFGCDGEPECGCVGMGGQPMKQAKTAYLAPRAAELTVTVNRAAQSEVQISLDLGIPNFTVFSISFPINNATPQEVASYIEQGLDAMLNEVAAFMVTMKYSEEETAKILAAAQKCFDQMNLESASDADMKDRDDAIRMYEGYFELPMSFAEETLQRVVTAATITRPPRARRIELKVLKPQDKANDPARIIQMYKNRTLKTAPRPFYVVVYDQLGRGAGTLKLPRNWESRLLKRM
jgi:hypothetical protein